MTIKALTIQNPWAWAVAIGEKTPENRSGPTRHRGLTAVHAGSRWSRRGETDPRILDAARRATDPRDRLVIVDGQINSGGFAFSCVLALVDLTDCHPDRGCCRPWGESTYPEHGGRTVAQVWHWSMELVERFDDPIHAVGRLGLWNWEQGAAA